LSPEEFQRIARWVHEREQQRDEQLNRDSTSGKLDLLFEEADDESKGSFFVTGPR